MNAETLNRYISLIANLGVVAGVIFLAVEIRENTRATDAEIAWARTGSSTELYAHLATTYFDSSIRLSSKTYSELTELPANDPDLLKMRLFTNSLQIHNETRFLTQSVNERATQKVKDIESNRSALNFFLLERLNLEIFRPEYASYLKDIIYELRIANNN